MENKVLFKTCDIPDIPPRVRKSVYDDLITSIINLKGTSKAVIVNRLEQGIPKHFRSLVLAKFKARFPELELRSHEKENKLYFWIN